MISLDQVKKSARLAKLKFNDEEINQFSLQLAKIMDMIDQMEEINVTGIEPLTSVCDTSGFMRDDIVTEKNLDADLFSNTPSPDAAFAKEIKCFIVPKVVE